MCQLRTRAFAQVHALERRALLSSGAPDADPALPGWFREDIAGVDEVTAVEVDRDGKIVVLGMTVDPQAALGTLPHLFLARYNSDGSPDAGFGGGGKVITDFDDFRRGFALALGADGKIVVGGMAFPGAGDAPVSGDVEVDFALARYNADGSLDRSFGDGGKVVTGIDPRSSDGVSALAVLGDGSVVAAGTSRLEVGPGVRRVAVARYRPNGRLDPSFGQGGLVHDIGAPLYDCSGLAVQADGKVVVGGTANGSFVVARLRANGSRDRSFAGDGVAEAGVPNRNLLGGMADLAVLGDGRIVVGGSGAGPHSLAPPIHPIDNLIPTDLVLARFSPDGTLDAAYGGGDGVAVDSLGIETIVAGLAFADDGSLYAAGALRDADGFEIAESLVLARYDPLGQRDRSFATDGRSLFRLTDGRGIHMDRIAGAALQSDGRVVLAATVKGPEDLAVARFDPDGSFDETFGAGHPREPMPPEVPVPPLPGGLTATFRRRTLILRGTSGADALVLRRIGATSPDGARLRLELQVGDDPSSVHAFNLTDARRIVILGGGGDDSIVVEPSVTTGCLLHGGSGDDRLTGGGGNDRLNGGRGNDTLAGASGDDLLFGASGDDRFFNRDPVPGGSATFRDTVRGGPGRDAADRDDENDLLSDVEEANDA